MIDEKPATVRLYKFYGAGRALENLKQRRLKISTIEELNDPFEFNSISFPDSSSRKIWNAARQKLSKRTGVICFCRSWSNPVIWSHYADSHKGLALGFDVAADLVVPVKYRKTRLRYPNLSQSDTNQLFSFIGKSIASKFDHWAYEDEVRVFTGLEDKDCDSGLFFKPFEVNMTLKEVVIGTRATLGSNEIQVLLSEEDKVTIKTARLAFHDFKIVPQRNRTLQK